MPLLSSIRQGVGTLWRGVLSAVGQGQSAYETSSRLTQAFQQIGVPPPPGSVQLVDQLTGYANDWISASSAVRAAEDSQGITDAMTTFAPWSMPLSEFNTTPSYHIVFTANVENVAEPQTRVITGVFRLPGTVGGLRDLVAANAEQMAIGTTPHGGMGGTISSITDITITVAPSRG